MKSLRPWLLLAVLGLLLAGGLSLIFRARLARDLYPKFSTQRADPSGIRAFHDACARLPGRSVTRFLRPIARLPADPPATILFAGGNPTFFGFSPADDFNAVDTAVRRGSRVVVALAPWAAAAPVPPVTKREETPAKKPGGETGPQPEKPDAEPTPANENLPRPAPVGVGERWGVETVAVQPPASEPRPERPRAVRAADAPPGLPDSLAWTSECRLKLDPAAGWRVLYTRRGEPVLAERRLGRGSLVVATDSYFLTNEALHRDRAPALLAWLLGPAPAIVFVESHLGVVEDPGIASLARRYGLAPALGLSFVLAALFLWHRLAPFVPPRDEPADIAIEYQPAAGLASLLRRALPRARLLPTCLALWRKSARPGEVPRVEAALAGGGDLVSGYNRAVQALRRR